MKKIKCLLIFCLFFIWCAISQSFAYKMRDLSFSYQWWSILSTSQLEQEVWFCADSFWQGYWTYLFPSVVSNCNKIMMWYSTRASYYFWLWGRTNSNLSSDINSQNFNNIKIEEDWNGWLNFYRYSTALHNWAVYNVPSRAWFIYTFTDWSQVLLDEVYFWHNSIIFQSSETLDTVQFVNDWWYWNRVFYCDPYEEWQNLYMIDFKNKKAWSSSVWKSMCFEIMFWNIKMVPATISQFDWKYSYTMSKWWVYFFPNTAWYYQRIQRNKNEEWMWWTYNLDVEMVDPDIWWSVNPWTSTWTLISDDVPTLLFNEYNSCRDWYQSLNYISYSIYWCARDILDDKATTLDYTTMHDYVLDLDEIIWNWSWSTVPTVWNPNCQSAIENARSFAYYEIISKNEPMSEYQRAVEPLFTNKNPNPYNIESYCWVRPTNPSVVSGSTSNNECSWSSWAWIVNCLWIGSSKTSTWSSSTLFDTAIDNISAMVSDSFLWKLITPIKTNFDEWRKLITWVSCTNSIITIPYIDIMTWGVAVILFFILFSLI